MPLLESGRATTLGADFDAAVGWEKGIGQAHAFFARRSDYFGQPETAVERGSCAVRRMLERGMIAIVFDVDLTERRIPAAIWRYP
jgi:hypothetical protein